MRRFVVTCIITVLAFPIFASEQPELLRMMADFDKNYIPALALTNQGKQSESINAIRRLRTNWAQWKLRYQDGYGTNPQRWQHHMSAIEQQITQAQNQINLKELADAHESLEQVRFTFMELRQENGIEYYLDYLTQFHEPMEEIAMIAAQSGSRTPEQLKLDILRYMKPLLSSWDRVTSADPPFGLFDVREDKQILINNSIADESESISQLESALQHGNISDIVKAARGIKPAFVRLYLAFGNFDGI